MRKWLYLALILAVVYSLSALGKKKRPAHSPFLKRVSETINILVWVLLAAYVFSFFYWLYTQFIR
jgi:ABC-type multidrug transport system permease subunit